MSTGFRVSIPNNMRKTIQAIKEITGNHSEEEIYAMLKECSMDPNETIQKLLLQDTFHEVKRKRDKRKENLSNRESGESRLRSGMRGRSRGGRGNYSPRVTSHDAGGSRNSSSGKKNGGNQVSEKAVALSSFPTSQDAKNKAPPMTSDAASGNTSVLHISQSSTRSAKQPEVSSSVGKSELGGVLPLPSKASTSFRSILGNAPSDPVSGNTSVLHISLSSARRAKQPEVSSSVDNYELGGVLHLPSKATTSCRSGKTIEHPECSSYNSLVSKTPASSSAVCYSSKDPVLVPPHDSQLPGILGAIKCEVGSQQTRVEQNVIAPDHRKSSVLNSEVGSSFMQGKRPNEPQIQGVRKNKLNESTQSLPASTQSLPASTDGGSIVNRPLSSNSNQPQVIGPLKVPSEEWKTKLTNSIPRQGSGEACTSEVLTMPDQGDACSPALSNGLDSEEATSKVQRKLEDLHLPDQKHSDQRHVIIPNHIQVPESERMQFCFGSIDSSFGVSPSLGYDLECDRSSTHSETSQGIRETVNGQASSDQNALPKSEEADHPSHAQSLTQVRENLSSAEGDVSTSAAPDYSEPIQETAVPPGGHRYSALHTSPSYSLGLVPPMLGAQAAQFESSDSQTRELTQTSSIGAQQTFDPQSYYAQLYRSNVDSDGRISPFHLPGVATKYNGDVAVLYAQTSQSSKEVVLSTAGPTALVTQPVGVMQSSVAVTQQSVPVFRQPTGLQFSHYPSNYIPYCHYFSPFYIPSPAIHQYLSNGAFPQQPQAGSVYPLPPPAAATGIKYSPSQYKPGTNISNATPVAMASNYGSYGSTPANYNPSSAATVNNTVNEDVAASQLKESNAHVSGKQTEGSAAWVAAPGRDIPGLQASSFYNLPHHGQHMTFTPTQVAHGTFGSVYHPGQAMTAANIHPLLQQSQTITGAADMGGPKTGVFQQPQLAQMKWPNSY